MIGKNKISSITRLHQKKYRDESGLFIVEGIKSVDELLRSDFEISEICALPDWQMKHSREIGDLPVKEVSLAEMERISVWKNPQEVLAIAYEKSQNEIQIMDDQPLLLLDDIRDPGNMGTIIRTADWFGIRQIVCSETTVEFYNPKVIQATMGSFARVNVFYTDLKQFIRQNLKDRRVWGAFLEGTPIGEIEFHSDDVVVIGNEANGISAGVAEEISDKLLIDSPLNTQEKAESLNASIAAAIIMFQMSRFR